jgi:hypothetical protein
MPSRAVITLACDSTMEANMGDDSATDEDRHFDLIDPMGVTLQTWRLTPMPLILFTAWWNQIVQACWPCSPPCHHAAHHEEHDQLVVPEPIEAEGEQSLFA